MASSTNVQNRARRILNDEESGAYRWHDDVLDDYIDQAVAETHRLRADAFLSSSGTVTESITALDAGWEGPLAEFVAAKALSEDNADVADAGRAEGLLAAYMGFALGNQA